VKSTIFILAVVVCVASARALSDPLPQSENSTAPACGAQKKLASVDMVMEPFGNIAIPVLINGFPFRFGVDTGAVFTVTTAAVANQLHFDFTRLNSEFELLGGVKSNLAGRSQSFTVGTLGAPKFAFMIMPSWAFDVGMDGLLGPDIMSTYDIDLDYGHAKFNIFSQDHCAGDVVYWTKDSYQKVPVNLEQDWHITAQVTIDGKTLTAAVDTGAADSVMSLDVARSVFGIVPDNPALKNLGNISINGTAAQALYLYPFQSLSLGSVTVSHPNIVIASKADIGNEAQLVLGLSTLRQFHIYIAYKEKALYVTPAEAQ
jgi:predicted aspartyl protease